MFLLWPQWVYWAPEGVDEFTSRSDGKFYAAMPVLFHGFEHALFSFYVFIMLMWFASFNWWFIIALNLWQILRQNIRLFRDDFVHIFVWGMSGCFTLCLCIVVEPHYDHYPNENKNHPDWIIMSFSTSFIMYIFGGICMSYLMFGLFLVCKTFCTTGLHPLRMRMSLFIGLTVLLTAPMFVELLCGWTKYMTLSLATLGLGNALVWATSSQFHQCFANRNHQKSFYSTGASFSAFCEEGSVTEDENAFRIFGDTGSCNSCSSEDFQTPDIRASCTTEASLKTYPQFYHALIF